MTRILKYVRDMVSRKAAERAVAEMKSENEELKRKLCGMFYAKWLKENTNAAVRKTMKEIPESVRVNFIRTETEEQRWCIRSEWSNKDGGRDYRRQTKRFPVPSPLTFPAAFSSGSLDITIERGDEYSEIWSEIQRNNTQIQKRYEEVRLEVQAVMRANATVKKLLAVWPDVKELLPEEMTNPKPKAHLPAFNPTKLNIAIGLPSDKQPKAKKAA